MTNIGVIAKRTEKGEMEFITAIADSQTTTLGDEREGHSKSDNSVKIHTVGDKRDILLLGTGPRNFILETAERLRSQGGLDTVEEAANAALEFTDQRFKQIYGDPKKIHDDGFGLNFLIAGPSKNDLSVMIVNTTGLNGAPGKPDYSKRGAVPMFVAKNGKNAHFDGSAFRHIDNYVRGQQEAGRAIVINNLTDGLVEIHDLGRRGAADLGANDKFHYGLIVPGRTVKLLNPSARFDNFSSMAEYFSQLGGFNLGEDVKRADSKDPVEAKESAEALYELCDFCGDFYAALRSELNDSSGIKRWYTSLAEELFHDPRYQGQLDSVAKLRRESIQCVAQGVEAMLSGKADNLNNYIEAHANKRRDLNRQTLQRYTAPTEKS